MDANPFTEIYREMRVVRGYPWKYQFHYKVQENLLGRCFLLLYKYMALRFTLTFKLG